MVTRCNCPCRATATPRQLHGPLATIMKRTIGILSIILAYNLTSYGQIKVDTLYHNQIEVRIYTYLLNQDTIVKVYFDHHTPRVTKKVKTNMGKIKRDLTFDGIADFVRTKYPSPSITTTDLSIDAPVKFSTTETPDLDLAIAKDSYYIDAINYYGNEIKKDNNSYLSYYNLAKMYADYNMAVTVSHDKVIKLLARCILLNPNFEDAYLLKARVHEKNGIIRGIMMSDPHVDIVDVGEIIEAINSLNRILKLNPDNTEAKEYLEELKNRYGKKYKL